MRYQIAIERGDALALHKMMTRRSQEALHLDEVKGLVERDETELRERSRRLGEKGISVEGEATLFLQDDRVLNLSLENGFFYVASEGVLPSRPRSVRQAAMLFQVAIAARDYHQVISLLSRAGRQKFEEAFSLMDSSLDGLETAIVDERRDRATIQLPDGMLIHLRRENAIWKIEELK